MKIPILYVLLCVCVQCVYVFGIKSGYFFFLFLFYFILKMYLISINLQTVEMFH